MPEILTLPRQQVFDSNGDPLAGAKLESYEAGTSTPLATYSDSGLSVANANPVVADSAGRFGAIFLKPQNYKFILKNSADVTIWTADNIPGGPGSTFSLSDNGATLGPEVILDRVSTSPAANDVLGGISFKGRDSAGGTDTYARVQTEIIDPAASSEDGLLNFLTANAGSLATRVKIGQGVQVGSPTGGDKGAGTLNLDSSLYLDGLLGAVWELVEEQTISSPVATVDFDSDLNSTADEYMIVFLNVKPETDDVSLHGRINNGAGWAASGHRYVAVGAHGSATPTAITYGSGSSGDNTSANIALSRIGAGNGVGTATGELISGHVRFANPDATGDQPLFEFRSGYIRSDAILVSIAGFGNYDTTSDAITGFRFFFSSGNVESGNFKLFRRRKA